jgi:hypothetical protein
MMPRNLGAFGLALISIGCAPTVAANRAPATIGLHTDFGGGIGDPHRPSGAIGLGGNVSFETAGCCGAGIYVAHTNLWAKKPADDQDPTKPRRAEDVTEGGLEFSIVVPRTAELLRLRLRAGIAGEPPKFPLLGRNAYAGGAALLVRAVGPGPLQIGRGGPSVDFFVGFSGWAFGPERSAAGVDGNSYVTGAVMAGVRMSGDYGVSFQ